MARVISVFGGHEAIIDDEDYFKVSNHSWALKDGYAVTTYGGSYKMHHLVFGKPPKGLVTDHKNGNKLDNRKENLQFVFQSYNMAKAHKDSKGYYWSEDRQRYCVSLCFFGTKINGGRFKTEIEAQARVAKLRAGRERLKV